MTEKEIIIGGVYECHLDDVLTIITDDEIKNPDTDDAFVLGVLYYPKFGAGRHLPGRNAVCAIDLTELGKQVGFNVTFTETYTTASRLRKLAADDLAHLIYLDLYSKKREIPFDCAALQIHLQLESDRLTRRS